MLMTLLVRDLLEDIHELRCHAKPAVLRRNCHCSHMTMPVLTRTLSFAHNCNADLCVLKTNLSIMSNYEYSHYGVITVVSVKFQQMLKIKLQGKNCH